jgi:polysaccharide biosynthesis/export protein
MLSEALGTDHFALKPHSELAVPPNDQCQMPDDRAHFRHGRRTILRSSGWDLVGCQPFSGDFHLRHCLSGVIESNPVVPSMPFTGSKMVPAHLELMGMKMHFSGENSCSTRTSMVVIGLALLLLLTGGIGCQTARQELPLADMALPPTSVHLNPGDVVQISFPGAPNLNRTEKIRLDGRLLLPLVGEVMAAGKTPAELQNDLGQLYGPQLQVKEVVVSIASSAASVVVSGAVARSGRIPMERPMTVLDAIMEAGGFDPRRANLKNVSVIRQHEGKYSKHTLDLRPSLRGQNIEPFYLQPFDIVYVGEKIF